MVVGGFRWFQVVPCFSAYVHYSQLVALIQFPLHFEVKILKYLCISHLEILTNE